MNNLITLDTSKKVKKLWSPRPGVSPGWRLRAESSVITLKFESIKTWPVWCLEVALLEMSGTTLSPHREIAIRTGETLKISTWELYCQFKYKYKNKINTLIKNGAHHDVPYYRGKPNSESTGKHPRPEWGL